MKTRIIFLAIFLLTACSDSDNNKDLVDDRVIARSHCGAEIVEAFSPDWKPLPAAAKLSVPPEVQAARDAILGPNATDPSQVRLWWYGVASFVASVGGHLFLFDAWEIVGMHKDYAHWS